MKIYNAYLQNNVPYIEILLKPNSNIIHFILEKSNFLLFYKLNDMEIYFDIVLTQFKNNEYRIKARQVGHPNDYIINPILLINKDVKILNDKSVVDELLALTFKNLSSCIC